jgi:AraC-like DNA-binding protein
VKGGVSDARAQQAREHHRAALAAQEAAKQLQRQRNELVRRLRAEDPQRWTYKALAGAVGCSPELIAAIIKQRTP